MWAKHGSFSIISKPLCLLTHTCVSLRLTSSRNPLVCLVCERLRPLMVTSDADAEVATVSQVVPRKGTTSLLLPREEMDRLNEQLVKTPGNTGLVKQAALRSIVEGWCVQSLASKHVHLSAAYLPCVAESHRWPMCLIPVSQG